MKKILLIIFIISALISCKKQTLEEKFHDSISYCNISNVQKLLKKGADVNCVIYQDETALNYLCGINRENSYEIADLLIKNGANTNSYTLETDTYEEKKFLFTKIEKKYCICNCVSVGKIELLIKNGAEIDVDCGNGITPLMYYIEKAYYEKSDYNNSYYNELINIIKILLENGADVNHKLENGVTPLIIALQYQNREVVDLLLQYGAEIHEDYVHLKLNPFRNTIFEDFGDEADYNFSELTSVCNAGYVDLLRKYMENHKVDLFSHSGDGYDYFFCAVQSDNPEMIEFLLPYYGNINSKRYTLIDLDNKPTYGYTLYGIAHHFGCEKIEKVLLDHGANGFTHY